MELIFEKSKEGRKGITLPVQDVPKGKPLEGKYLREKAADLPNVSELEVVRHFTNLSKMNFCIDSNFYPLGSCTMKYNPKFTEKAACLEGFASQHPLKPQVIREGKMSQGALEIIYGLEKCLCALTGMEAFTTQPMAGANGELTGIMLISAYHRYKGNKKRYVIVPDSGHGTNPASSTIAGYEVKSVASNSDGVMDLASLEAALNDEVAACMLTSPNTLGIFNPHIKDLADAVHKCGALMYCDGANFNAIMGKVLLSELGFDCLHLNLHKTFATPHGGGGPGAGPVGVNKKLLPFLPVPRIVKNEDDNFALDYTSQLSIGQVAPFYGNFSVLLKAYAYILLLGKEGLIEASETAVLNANYLLKKLENYYDIPHDKNCLHEFVISAVKQAAKGVHAVDIAKALIDKGIHPPTIYFPLIVKEAIMVEPTETESKETLDRFSDIMIELAKLAQENPEFFKAFPQNAPVERLDEVKAVKDMNVAC